MVISTVFMSILHHGGPPRHLPCRPHGGWGCWSASPHTGWSSSTPMELDLSFHTIYFRCGGHLYPFDVDAALWRTTSSSPMTSPTCVRVPVGLISHGGAYSTIFHFSWNPHSGWGWTYASSRTWWTTSTSLERGYSTHTLSFGCGDRFYPSAGNAALGDPPLHFPYSPHGAWGWR